MNQGPNCVVYNCDHNQNAAIFQSSHRLRRFNSHLASIVGDPQANGAVSECLWLIPTWEAFEEASA